MNLVQKQVSPTSTVHNNTEDTEGLYVGINSVVFSEASAHPGFPHTSISVRYEDRGFSQSMPSRFFSALSLSLELLLSEGLYWLW